MIIPRFAELGVPAGLGVTSQLKTEQVKTEVRSYQIGGKIGFLPPRNLLTPPYTSFTTLNVLHASSMPRQILSSRNEVISEVKLWRPLVFLL